MLANLFSAARIALVPFLLYSISADDGNTSAFTLGLLAAAVFSDAADGFAARRLGQVSQLGQALDPIADKIFLGSLTFALVYWRGFPAWLVVLLVVRDLAIVAAGVYLHRRYGRVIQANVWGKLSTAVLCAALFAFLLPVPLPLRQTLVWGAAALLLLSAFFYGRLFIGRLQKSAGAE